MPATITAEEIKEIRGRYGLSQRSFAQLLGIGPASMVRYEQGATPTKANANLIRAAKNPQFMAECLEADGKSIPQTQFVRAQSVIYDYISLDEEENEYLHEGVDVSGLPQTMSMDEMYSFTLQQEILNEQAANLISELITMKLSLGVLSTTNEALLNRLTLLKPTIISEESLNNEKLSEIRGFLQLAQGLIFEQIERAAS
ncbi:MAG: helix-turn-helix domain-containing protein [Eggerthellaceae bacterium]|nr:helix-turn-helix domain-containing protein [Eggerthellaceae bacterium]